jgi:glycosyltransferase involved in cell wall biosynthesis
MRFHVLAVPHTVTNKQFVACAFTQKVLKFCEMMTRRGHTVIHYGHPDSEVVCTEHVNVITRETYTRVYGNYDWKVQNFKFDLRDDAYQEYNAVAIREIRARQQPNDFVLAFWGQGNKAICDALSDMKVVEPGIGYSQAFAPYRIYESYALMHANLGLDRVQYSCNMPWYHVVIPNYFDPRDFEFTDKKQDYFLYLGRITRAKGVDLAINVTSHIGAKLIIAGQGAPEDLGLKEWPSHVKYLGYAFAEQRRELMKNAKGVFIFSTYVEPFAGVMIESFLSGTPVISTDWGTFAENNLHGVTGYRCRTFDHMVWAARNVERIDPHACLTWGQNFTLDKVAPMYEEYFQSALKSWYSIDEDRTQLDWLIRTMKKPLTIDAFFQCHSQVRAADKALESYRKCYPEGKVVMINDGGDDAMKDVASKYGAIYEYRPNIGICHWKKPTEWLERFFEAIEKLESDYFVMQEEDVFHVRSVDQTKLVHDICGTNPDARLPPVLAEYTGRTHYAGSGGCFFRTAFFKRIAKTDWPKHVEKIPAEWLHADVVLSVVTYMNGGTIGYCTECVELNRPEYQTNKNPAVIHQYKLNYGTRLCTLAEKYGSDKCPAISHTYTPSYHALLNDKKVDNFLEIGIGNVPLMKHIVGETYQPGASLRMWRDYFPGASIYGCDIDKSVMFEEDRIKTFWVDQGSTRDLETCVPKIGYDVILDDGSHLLNHMMTSFRALWPRVAPNGLYIIEDINDYMIDPLKALSPDDVLQVHRGNVDGDSFIVFQKKPTKILWVSAFRDIHRDAWPCGARTFDEYLECFERLIESLGKDLVCFIDEPHADRVKMLGVETRPYDIDDTYIPKHYARQKELIDTQAFHHLLPENLRTCQEYTNPDYGLTLYSKQCFVRRASDLFPGYTHYAWVDFGYARSDDDVPVPMSVPGDKVYISSFRRLEFDEDREPVLGEFGSETVKKYNWNNPHTLLKNPMYAVQGNLWFVPRQLTHWLEKAMDHSIERQHAAGVILGHDEPVWLSVIHDFRSRFEIHIKTEWQYWNWNYQTHVHKLRRIIEASGEACEGNVLWHHHQFAENGLNKCRNLYTLARDAQKILEVGFNAGHSCLLYLLANPTSQIDLFDLGEHSYTRPCFEYLDSQFPGRLKIVYGDSRETLKNAERKVYNLIHIDGGHDEDVVRSDLENTMSMCDKNTVFVSDDDEQPQIYRLNREYLIQTGGTPYQFIGFSTTKSSA